MVAITRSCARLTAVRKRGNDRIALEHPEYTGTYTVERRPGGRLLLEPLVGPSEADMVADAGGRHLTTEEFAEEFGELPTDDEP